MFLSEPFSEEKCKPPTIPWWWWWVGRVRVRVNNLFFLSEPFKKLVSQILSTSLRKNVNRLLKKPTYLGGGGGGGGGVGDESRK